MFAKKKVKLKKINNQEVYNSKLYNKTAGIAWLIWLSTKFEWVYLGADLRLNETLQTVQFQSCGLKEKALQTVQHAEKKYTELRPIVIVQMGTILYRNGKKHGPIVIVQMLTILLFFFV